MLKRRLVRTMNSAVAGKLVTVLERAESRRPNILRVVTYHRVESHDLFAQHARYLAKNCQVVSGATVIDAFNGRTKLPPRSVMITFDDAYRSFDEIAWPVLKEFTLPVTVFVPTAFPDRPDRVFWWDQLQHALRTTPRRDQIATPAGRISLASSSHRDRAYRRLRVYVKTLPHHQAMDWVSRICEELGATQAQNDVMGWASLRRLAGEGVTLGTHTRTHPLLNRIPREEALAEAVGSLRDLEEEIGSVHPIIAYPDGQCTDEVVTDLREAGFMLAFTTRVGVNDLRHADALRMRRLNLGPQATQSMLRYRLAQAWMSQNR